MDRHVHCTTNGCERKGIVLGIVYYILKHHRYFTTHTIQCDDNWYREILGHIFPTMRFVKKKSNVFQINIKNHLAVGLVINNINNLPHIYGKSVYWLPYYEPNNPLVMYRAIDGAKDRRGKVARKIRRFQRHRGCEWEPEVEQVIMDKYARLYGNAHELYAMIDRLCGEHQGIEMGMGMGTGISVLRQANMPVIPYPTCPTCPPVRACPSCPQVPMANRYATCPTCPPVRACPPVPVCPTGSVGADDYARLFGLLGDKFEALNRIVDAKQTG